MVCCSGLAADKGLSFHQALSAVTSIPGTMFAKNKGIGRIVVGSKANLVLFDRAPLTLAVLPTHTHMRTLLVHFSLRSSWHTSHPGSTRVCGCW